MEARCLFVNTGDLMLTTKLSYSVGMAWCLTTLIWSLKVLVFRTQVPKRQ